VPPGRILGLGPGLEDKGLLRFVDHGQIEASRIELAQMKCVAPRKGNFTELMRYLTPGTEVVVIDRLDEYARGMSAAEFHDGFEFFVRRLHERGITALMLMDGTAPAGWKKLAMESMGGVIQFFLWDNPRTGRRERALDIVKMAGAQAPMGALPYELDSGGIAVRLDGERPHENPTG
jgi:KaiC/GvpD/RAD55 family RecA-like ATPase